MEELYDVIVVGGGPAGLTAALYLARAKCRCLVLEKEQFGGQIAITDEVVNYPGIEKISGKALTDAMRGQAERFGATFLQAEATGFDFDADIKSVQTDRGQYRCFGVLLATGAHPRTVGFQGEEVYKGHGVAYCATCDGEFFTGKDVFVVGGGYAAAEESVFLTKFARHVTILVRKDDFSCAASVAEKAKKHEKITVLTNTVLEEVSGEDGLTYARYKNIATGEVTEYKSEPGESFGVFVFAGYAPATESVREKVRCNEQGYICTDTGQKTNIDGVYAAGDVCIKPLRQVVTATGDGALAATELEKYVLKMQEKTGQKPKATEGQAPEKAEDAALFDGSMRRQLDTVFARMEQDLVLKLFLDNRKISTELKAFAEELSGLSERLTVQQAEETEEFAPCVKVLYRNGQETGLGFHGVPGGHEFTPFILGLYHAASPDRRLDEQTRAEIAAIREKADLKILVTLSCSMCPDLVQAAQQIAVENPNVRAEVYDIRHFEALKKRYNVMSVPCMVINDEKVVFGKKNIRQILDLIRSP